jgi:hypothetical protein
MDLQKLLDALHSSAMKSYKKSLFQGDFMIIPVEPRYGWIKNDLDKIHTIYDRLVDEYHYIKNQRDIDSSRINTLTKGIVESQNRMEALESYASYVRYNEAIKPYSVKLQRLNDIKNEMANMYTEQHFKIKDYLKLRNETIIIVDKISEQGNHIDAAINDTYVRISDTSKKENKKEIEDNIQPDIESDIQQGGNSDIKIIELKGIDSLSVHPDNISMNDFTEEEEEDDFTFFHDNHENKDDDNLISDGGSSTGFDFDDQEEGWETISKHSYKDTTLKDNNTQQYSKIVNVDFERKPVSDFNENSKDMD